MQKTVLTIGEILVEIMATDRGDGFREPLSLVGPFPSGAPAIFIDQAARFGQSAAMIGCVGDDDFGRVNLDRLARDGVDVSGIAVDPEAATGSAFVRYRPDGTRAFVFNIKHSASGRTRLTDAAQAVLARSHHLHVMGTALFSPSLVDTVLSALTAIKARGGTVSFDPNLRPEMLGLPGLRVACEAIFARCDLFLPSGPELTLFTAAKGEEDAITEILARGIRAIVLKRGVDGASYRDGTTRIDQPGFAVTEIDPTGAGIASARPSSAAGCAAWSRPGHSPMRPLAAPAPSRGKARWKAHRPKRSSTPSWPRDMRGSAYDPVVPATARAGAAHR